MVKNTLALGAALAAMTLAAPAFAKPSTSAKLTVHPVAEAQALDLAQKAIAIRSVAGPGNKTGDVAALFRDSLVAGGFDPAEISITPLGDTAYLIATWRGSDPALKPLVLSGHMDVVEAKREDWQRDPFVPMIEDGYLYGRGATDMKFDGALAIAALLELKREGFRPRRSIVIEFSGDEETTMRTSRAIAEKLSNAELVLNIDGGGGSFDEKSGKPRQFTWQGAEKTYADFELTVTNPGGHSSMPRPVNAINQLAAALLKIGQHHFTPEVSPLTREYFERSAKLETDPARASAMRAFAANPADGAAVATLSADPAMIGKIGTTCVVTMINGGHALNALPQRATANINCRIFPGHAPAAIMAELEQAAGDPAVKFRDVTEGSVASPASPMRPDFTAALEKAIHSVYPGVPVIPAMASGASDSMWFRSVGVPSYGASPVFIKDSEDFSHGLNERTPVSNVRPAIDYYLSLVMDLSR
ncbi:M20/M25/M40 family metallo-hydrolase [Novosphingobium lentum]|uniref:M20/M25/M40 family metallo-hydrolase n=1 Tax=Novosphingobium lentum TaxID=145287 RepID=UPI00082FFDF4|nr:M20/M25/M40 family metallo-hydrolase [Novosphingobium lentum]